jgi:hypothetical protein
VSARRRIDHERVLELWAEGRSSVEIAAALGLQRPETARGIVLRARRRGDRRAAPRLEIRAQPPEAQEQVLVLPPPLAAGVAAEAGRRQLPPGEFCLRLIETCIREKLVEAVLDDAAGAAA